MALAERRYRRNRSVSFYRHLARTGSAFPRLPRRFAPHNDNLGECRGAPAPLHGLIPLYKALTARKGHAASVRRQSRQRLRSERRYRRKRSVRFFGSRYGTAVPSRDCTPRALPRASRSGRHVGLRPPRNDKFRGIAPLNLFRNHCQPAWRSLTAATDAIGLYVFIVSLFLALVQRRARLSAPLHFPLRCRKIPPGRVFIPAGM